MNDLITEVFVKQLRALPGSAKYQCILYFANMNKTVSPAQFNWHVGEPAGRAKSD